MECGFYLAPTDVDSGLDPGKKTTRVAGYTSLRYQGAASPRRSLANKSSSSLAASCSLSFRNTLGLHDIVRSFVGDSDCSSLHCRLGVVGSAVPLSVLASKASSARPLVNLLISTSFNTTSFSPEVADDAAPDACCDAAHGGDDSGGVHSGGQSAAACSAVGGSADGAHAAGADAACCDAAGGADAVVGAGARAFDRRGCLCSGSGAGDCCPDAHPCNCDVNCCDVCCGGCGICCSGCGICSGGCCGICGGGGCGWSRGSRIPVMHV